MIAGILTEMIESTSTSVLIITGNTEKSIKTERCNQDPEKCLGITKKETHTMIKSLMPHNVCPAELQRSSRHRWPRVIKMDAALVKGQRER